MLAGFDWLVRALERNDSPAPIGLYFARLWYFESLYPTLFALGAFANLEDLNKTA